MFFNNRFLDFNKKILFFDKNVLTNAFLCDIISSEQEKETQNGYIRLIYLGGNI